MRLDCKCRFCVPQGGGFWLEYDPPFLLTDLLDDPLPALTHGPISQADFLTRMGIDVRVEALKTQASPERGSEIEKAARRLTDLTGMGKQYQVMGFTSKPIPEEENGPWPFIELEGPRDRVERFGVHLSYFRANNLPRFMHRAETPFV